MLDEKGSSKWWVWCVASADSVFYNIHKSRSASAAKELLGGFKGVVITDGYSAYESALKNLPPGDIVHAHCWAHVRRKFLDAEENYREESKKPIEWIGKLFEIERKLPKLSRGECLSRRMVVLDERKSIREELSRPIINELRDWAHKTFPTLLPSSSIGKAVSYMMNLWKGLIVFLSNPRIPIDNNHAEREIRGVVIGRKNHYGSKSKRGSEVAAIFYTLFESAKLIGVDPSAYLLEAARRAIRNPGTITLPHEFLT